MRRLIAPARLEAGLSSCARQIVRRLEAAAIDPDSLAAVMNLPLPAVTAALTELELAGCAQRCAGGYIRSLKPPMSLILDIACRLRLSGTIGGL